MGAPEGNTNAEKWTFEESEKFLKEALELSYDKSYDFIGEILQDLREDKGTIDYLIKKFPKLMRIKNRIENNCETNCFRNAKKGKIKEATAIVNLKSNHGWTDRTRTELSGEIKTEPPVFVFKNLNPNGK